MTASKQQRAASVWNFEAMKMALVVDVLGIMLRTKVTPDDLSKRMNWHRDEITAFLCWQ